jgi:hypothetical protein
MAKTKRVDSLQLAFDLRLPQDREEDGSREDGSCQEAQETPSNCVAFMDAKTLAVRRLAVERVLFAGIFAPPRVSSRG